jgi:hypothetical protein
MRNRWVVCAALTALLTPQVYAASYVTDRLSAPLYGANADDAPVVKQVVAGAPLTVLERSGTMFKVRTEDGSVGWMSAALIIDEKPLQTLFIELSDRHNKAQEQIRTLQTQGVTGDSGKIVVELRGELKAALDRLADSERNGQDKSNQLTAAQTRIGALEKELAGIKGAVSAAATGGRDNYYPTGTAPQTSWFKTVVPMPWLVGGLILSLALGVGTGLWSMDRYVRKRHGGFRVY